MSLSHRVTELLENAINKIFNAMVTIPVPTTTKSSKILQEVDDTVDGTEIISSNPNRIFIFIQNQSTIPLLVNFEDDVSINNYCMILPGATSVRNGDGGTYTSDTWKGSIKGFVESGTVDVTIFEEVIL